MSEYLQSTGKGINHQPDKGTDDPDRYLNPEPVGGLRFNNMMPVKRGFCIWFTGLSGAGKSTVADLVVAALTRQGHIVTLLDGDSVRMNLSKGLGFTKEDRDTNVRRIGYVASEIVKHGGAVVCAAISPYREIRNECRKMIAGYGFVEVFVNTPLEVCEARDPKGLYSMARSGKLKNFTGVNDPYEPPECPEITIDSSILSPGQAAGRVISYLVKSRFLGKDCTGRHFQ